MKTVKQVIKYQQDLDTAADKVIELTQRCCSALCAHFYKMHAKGKAKARKLLCNIIDHQTKRMEATEEVIREAQYELAVSKWQIKKAKEALGD